MFDKLKLAAKLNQRSRKEDDDDMEEEILLNEVIRNSEKNPLPQLVPMPEGLTKLQVTFLSHIGDYMNATH